MEGQFSEFKTNLNFEFKPAIDSDTDQEGHVSVISSEDGAKLDSRREVHAQTQQEHHLKSPSSRYKIEKMTSENSVLSMHPAPPNKTSLGFAPHAAMQESSEARMSMVD